MKCPKTFRNRSKVLPILGQSCTKKWKFLIFSGRISTPGAIEVKFCTAMQTHVPVRHTKFLVNRCKETPLRGEKPDFRPVSKFITGVLRFAQSCR